jgi:hypothetical protein
MKFKKMKILTKLKFHINKQFPGDFIQTEIFFHFFNSKTKIKLLINISSSNIQDIVSQEAQNSENYGKTEDL